MANLLEIENLTVELMSHRGIVYALSGVDLAVRPAKFTASWASPAAASP